MAARLQQFDIGGQMVWVEVEDLPPPKQAKAGKPTKAATRGGGKTEKTSTAADAAVEKLEKVDIARTLKAVIGPVRAALDAVKPDEVSVEVSLGLKGEVGVFVAKSEGSASLKVTAKWKLEDARPAPGKAG